MKSKTCTGMVLVLADYRRRSGPNFAPTQFSGVINDYSPTTSSPMGPWEMRGPWTLTLNQDIQQGRLFGDLDDGTVRLHAKRVEYRFSTSATTGRMQHTHHIGIVGGTSRKLPRAGLN